MKWFVLVSSVAALLLSVLLLADGMLSQLPDGVLPAVRLWQGLALVASAFGNLWLYFKK